MCATVQLHLNVYPGLLCQVMQVNALHMSLISLLVNSKPKNVSAYTEDNLYLRKVSLHMKFTMGFCTEVMLETYYTVLADACTFNMLNVHNIYNKNSNEIKLIKIITVVTVEK